MQMKSSRNKVDQMKFDSFITHICGVGGGRGG